MESAVTKFFNDALANDCDDMMEADRFKGDKKAAAGSAVDTKTSDVPARPTMTTEATTTTLIERPAKRPRVGVRA